MRLDKVVVAVGAVACVGAVGLLSHIVAQRCAGGACGALKACPTEEEVSEIFKSQEPGGSEAPKQGHARPSKPGAAPPLASAGAAAPPAAPMPPPMPGTGLGGGLSFDPMGMGTGGGPALDAADRGAVKEALAFFKNRLADLEDAGTQVERADEGGVELIVRPDPAEVAKARAAFEADIREALGEEKADAWLAANRMALEMDAAPSAGCKVTITPCGDGVNYTVARSNLPGSSLAFNSVSTGPLPEKYKDYFGGK